jgi:hypothetical protein
MRAPLAVAAALLVAVAAVPPDAAPRDDAVDRAVERRMHTVRPIWPGKPYRFACPAKTLSRTCQRIGRPGTSKCFEPEIETQEVLNALTLALTLTLTLALTLQIRKRALGRDYRRTNPYPNPNPHPRC